MNRFLGNWLVDNIPNRPGRAFGVMDSNFFGKKTEKIENQSDVWRHSLFIKRFEDLHKITEMKRCAYFNPLNLPSGGPRMKSELPHNRRKALKLRASLLESSPSRKRRDDFEIDFEYEEMKKLISKLPDEADISRRSDKKVLNKIRNSENFFDLFEMALEGRKSHHGSTFI